MQNDRRNLEAIERRGRELQSMARTAAKDCLELFS